MHKPQLINFNKIGEDSLGYISVAEVETNIPFQIKRVFWTYETPKKVTRGKHAHQQTEQVLIAMSGLIKVEVEHQGNTYSFELSKPNQGIYLPKCSWVTMNYSENAVQMVIASDTYNPDDYIYDKKTFNNL